VKFGHALDEWLRGKPFIEKHRSEDEHDWVATGSIAHTCKPMAASTVRQIHSIISGTFSAAIRWDWISSNPARVTKRPKAKAPSPTTVAEAARLIDAAFEPDDDWGTSPTFRMRRNR